MKRVALIGAGGHARVVWDALNSSPHDEARVVAVLDDDAKLWGRRLGELTIAGPAAAVADMRVDAAIIGIGDNRARCSVYELVRSLGVPLINVLHPTAILAADVELGLGIVAFANVVVNTGTQIEDNVILNTACTVDHDCVIGAHVHIAPGTHLAGSVSVGKGTLLGIGSAAIPNVSIGQWVTAGAGTIITQDIPDHVTIVGAPARIV